MTRYRAILSSTVIFVQQSRNFWGLVGSLERDQELGINARLVAGAVTRPALCADVLHGGHRYRRHRCGPGVDHLKSRAADQRRGLLGLEWRVYKFTDPETSLTLGIALYPSLTESDRYRGNGHLSLTHKIAGDFTLGSRATGPLTAIRPTRPRRRVTTA